MLSLEQIKSVTFDRIVRGYRPDDVDDFVVQIAQQLEQLMGEKQDLENKLYVLADSVEKYRGEEETLKAALINAQRLGESVIREANQKAEQIIREAKAKSEREYDSSMEKVHSEQMHLTRLQQEVSRFRGALLSAYKSHIELLSALPAEEISAEHLENTLRGQESSKEEKNTNNLHPQFEASDESLSASDTRVIPPIQQFGTGDPFKGNVSQFTNNHFHANTELTQTEREEAASRKAAANATQEIEPIIPLAAQEEPATGKVKKKPSSTPTGKISIFEPYSEFELEDE